MDEAEVTINGIRLNSSQSMALRVAFESSADRMSAPDSLGKDAKSRELRAAYLDRFAEIRQALYREEHG